MSDYIKKERLCTVGNCGNVHYARGYCSKHYKQLVRKTICKVSDCKRYVDTKGYCQKHYRRYRKYGDPDKTYERISDGICKIDGCNGRYYALEYCSTHYHKYVRNEPCKINGCDDKAYVRGYCTTHYQRLLKHGDPLKAIVNMDYEDVCSIDGCEGGYFAKELCKKHYDRHYRKSATGRMSRKVSQTKRRAMKAIAPFNDFTRNDWINCLKHFDNECAYCGEENSALDQEHVIPISRGGSHTKVNIIPSCGSCNSIKGTRALLEWYYTHDKYDINREKKILKYLEYKITENNIQASLF